MKKNLLLLISAIMLPAFCILAQNPSRPALVIHGGAGTIAPGMMTDSLEKEIRSALQAALEAGYAVLDADGSATDAVIAAITILEDSHHFNAGKGAVMNEAGTHELDASIMDGATLDAGAVAGITNVKNPIMAAKAVMKASPHVMMAGKGAELFAESQKLELVENTYFTTPKIKASWERGRQKKINGEGSLGKESSKFGTVGAVAIDKNGNIAAGTSTGGMMDKRYGRIGDSPIIGAGTYADNNTCGISCTGHGEYFIRVAVAKEISDQMQFGNKTLQEAIQFTLHEKLTKMEGQGGLIAIDKNGNIAMEFNTPGMYRGFKNERESQIQFYGN